MAEQVTVEVVLRLADGSSVLDAKEAITADNIAKYRVGEDVVEEAAKKLEELGFKVLQTGPTGLTISGDKIRFESVFQTTLETRKTETMGTKIEAMEVSYYEAAKRIQIPENLALLIADLILPTPPKFFP